MNAPDLAYRALEGRFAKIGHLRAVEAVLFWDSKTMMPASGAASRADQMETIAGLKQSLLNAPDMADLLDAADAEGDSLGDWRRANLREMRRVWLHACVVDAKLAAEVARTAALASAAWAQAKRENDFSLFAPLLAVTIDVQRRVAECKAAQLSCSAYDALLDAYDPGTRSCAIDEVFAEIERFLPPLLERVVERQASHTSLPLDRRISQPKQERLIREILPRMGYSDESSRLDATTHPFTMAEVPGDVRITTRYDESNFMSSLIGAFHESGHALYEMGLPTDYRYQPVGDARGSSLHESQSLGIEMQACRSEEFLHFLFPRLRACFGVSGPAWNDENLLREFRRVVPGFIRVDADEVTYPLHVILRYRIERALLDGSLQVRDLPQAWNEAMQRLLGVRPATDADGCLQDIHWSAGLFGYFPTYVLGAVKAAQFFSAACRADARVRSHLRVGDFEPWIDWLRAHVHRWGSFHSGDALLRDATGSPLDVRVFKDHLLHRYLD